MEIIGWLLLCLALTEEARGWKMHNIYWNTTNPMFRIDNTDNVIDVNVGNTRWEYDQANFICPQSNNDNEGFNSRRVSILALCHGSIVLIERNQK